MTYIEKLLEACPELSEGKVEWKTLGEVTFRTSNINWDKIDSDCRYIDLSSVCRATNKIIDTTVITSTNSPSRARKLVFSNDVIFATTRPTQMRYCLVPEEYSGEVASTGYCVLRANTAKVLPKWILHWVASSNFKLYLKDNQSGSAYPAISDAKVKKFRIPIPPLSVQQEIVRILDKFTQLTAELTAELTARKKQYAYYRDELLSFKEGEVEWKTLGEMCNIGDGLHGTPKYDDSGEYYFINGNNLNNGRICFTDKTKKVSYLMFEKHGIEFTAENTIFLSINGTIGSVSFYNNEKIVLGKSVAFFNIKSSELNLKYLYYFLQTDFSKKYYETNKTGSTIKNLGLKALRSFKIPIPSPEEQSRIVGILDKFDTLCSSISEGLPKEIELRKKQYEYYREKLLNFE